MLNRKKKITILLLITVLTASILSARYVEAAETIVLKELIAEARENNAQLKSLRELVKAKDAGARVEGFYDDPTLKVEMEDLAKKSPQNTAPGNAMMTRYTLSQMLPFPGKLSLKERIAGKETIAARALYAEKELEVLANLKEAFYGYAYLTEAVKLTEEIKGILAYMSKIAESRYATGLAPQQDVIKVQLENTMLANELIMLSSEKEMAAARIKPLIGKGQDYPLPAASDLPKNKIEFETEVLIEAAIRKNPGILMLESEAAAGDLGVELAKKDYYPDFMLGLAPIQKDGRFETYDVMFQMTIPIWWGKNSGKVTAASAGASSARARLLAERLAKSFEVKEAALQAKAASNIMSLFKTGIIPQAEMAFESAMKNYQSGKVDFLTLLESGREIKKTRLNYLKTVLEYRKKLASLERVSATELGE
ncbi:MAG: TolC family protein [Deltaproteobacteria bacterium]|nr:TolC family protein [Deltaproteobacteria bacterium]